MKTAPTLNAERTRLEAQRDGREDWRLWGPYLAERAWGTVREDYSPHGTAWEYFDHDQARSRAYRWNEDGIGRHLRRAAAPVLRARAVERPRSDPQGACIRAHRQPGQPRRGREGVLLLPRRHALPQLDALPLQVSAGRVPVWRLVEENARRSRNDPPFTLLDTGVFDDGRYFDVEVRYAKASPEEIHIRVIATNRGPETATLHLLPTLWFRNTWSWGDPVEKPVLARDPAPEGAQWAVQAEHPTLGDLLPVRPPRGDAALHREREQRGAPVGRAERHAVREGRVPPPRRPRRGGRSEPGPHRHQVRRLARAHRRAGPRGDHRHDPVAGRAARRRSTSAK